MIAAYSVIAIVVAAAVLVSGFHPVVAIAAASTAIAAISSYLYLRG